MLMQGGDSNLRGGGLASMKDWVIDHPWQMVILALSVLFVWWAIGTRSQPHHVKASFPTAMNFAKGMDVQIDGIDAGKVSKVEYLDGHAVVDLGINEDRFWPLHVGTTVTQRWGTTID